MRTRVKAASAKCSTTKCWAPLGAHWVPEPFPSVRLQQPQHSASNSLQARPIRNCIQGQAQARLPAVLHQAHWAVSAGGCASPMALLSCRVFQCLMQAMGPMQAPGQRAQACKAASGSLPASIMHPWCLRPGCGQKEVTMHILISSARMHKQSHTIRICQWPCRMTNQEPLRRSRCATCRSRGHMHACSLRGCDFEGVLAAGACQAERCCIACYAVCAHTHCAPYVVITPSRDKL